VREPWRAALGYLSLESSAAPAFEAAFRGVDGREYDVAAHQISRRLNSPLASSMGRLFDAVAAVLGTRRVSYYEGQAAMELEALAGRRTAAPLPFPIIEEQEKRLILDPLPLLISLGERRASGHDVPDLAAEFHESVTQATVEVARRLREETGIETVALGGGVFQNTRLLNSVRTRLVAIGFAVLVPRLLSPNDGAISYGQAAVAAALMRGDFGE
jgi:hydrogenase maturation protein HypF